MNSTPSRKGRARARGERIFAGTRVILTCPSARANAGNGVTAERWAAHLRALGCRVDIQPEWFGEDADLLLALHARKGAASVRRFRRAHPDRAIVVALTGTDLYHDLPHSSSAQRSIELADRLVALQPKAARVLPASARRKLVVILQSAKGSARPLERTLRRRAANEPFRVVVLAHLRFVKDPLRVALASRLLTSDSKIVVQHAGAALSDTFARRAKEESKRNPRYQWLGDLSRVRAARLLAHADLLVVSSRLEGGANVVSEAAALGIPILATRIDGSVGLLGERHPGYFPVGDTPALARLLTRAEREPRYLERLRRSSLDLRAQLDPKAERAAWEALLGDLLQPGSRRFT